MAQFKKWLDGDKDLFNQEIEPQPIDESKIKSVDKKLLEASISKKEKQLLVHRHISRVNSLHLAVSIIVFVLYIAMLLYTTTTLQPLGQANTAWNYVARYYIDHSLVDTRAVNSVTGMILDYRAFDTLGESFVLFSAITCVFILLQGVNDDTYKDAKKTFIVHYDLIVRFSGLSLVPIILVYGVYVVLNGHLSPGGGFSGGAILGAGLILFSLAYGDKVAEKFITLKVFKTISAIALFGYATTKCYSFFMGGMHIVRPEAFHDPIAEWFASFSTGSILSGGYILILNICVGAVVACTMYGFYRLFKKGAI